MSAQVSASPDLVAAVRQTAQSGGWSAPGVRVLVLAIGMLLQA